MKTKTFLAAICCSLLTVGTASAVLPEPILDLPFDEEIVGDSTSVFDDERGCFVREFKANNPIETEEDFEISGSSARTFSYWAKVNPTSEWDDTWAFQAGANETTNEFFALYHKGGHNNIVITDRIAQISPANPILVFESGDGVREAWCYFTVVIEEGAVSSDMKIYKNGVFVTAPIYKRNWNNAPAGETYTLNTAVSKLKIGGLRGRMSQVKVFNEALTADQVKKLYDAENPEATPTSIVANELASRIQVQGKTIFVNGTADIQIFDALGRVAMQQSNVNGQMNVEGLQGMYILRANIDGQMATKKVVF